MTGSVTREIVLELNVEQPVHALHTPVTAHAIGEPVDVENGSRDVEARLERAPIGVFDSRMDLDQKRLYVGEARLAWIAPLGENPIHFGRSRVGSHLNAAVCPLDRALADEFFRRSGTEVVFDLGFEERVNLALS
jgi:hypothetical protein